MSNYNQHNYSHFVMTVFRKDFMVWLVRNFRQMDYGYSACCYTRTLMLPQWSLNCEWHWKCSQLAFYTGKSLCGVSEAWWRSVFLDCSVTVLHMVTVCIHVWITSAFHVTFNIHEYMEDRDMTLVCLFIFMGTLQL